MLPRARTARERCFNLLSENSQTMMFTLTYQPASDVRERDGCKAGALHAPIGWGSESDAVGFQDMNSAGFECGGRTS